MLMPVQIADRAICCSRDLLLMPFTPSTNLSIAQWVAGFQEHARARIPEPNRRVSVTATT
jgi:hypothetical protein